MIHLNWKHSIDQLIFIINKLNRYLINEFFHHFKRNTHLTCLISIHIESDDQKESGNIAKKCFE